MSKREREPWGRFAAKAGVLGVCICLAIGYLSDRYRIGRDPQIVRSLGDYTTFLVDRYRSEARRGEIVAFRAQGLTQYFEDGTLMAKKVVGMPGDHVQVDPTRLAPGVWINGRKVLSGFMHQHNLGLSDADLLRDEQVPPQHFFVIGTTNESYDSRYWGYIRSDQIVGSVQPLF